MYPTQQEPFRVWLGVERKRVVVDDVELAERAGLSVTLLREIERSERPRPSNSGQRARLVGALVEIEKERELARLRGVLEAL